MAHWNAPFEVEEIEQLALIDRLQTHHDPLPVAESLKQTESSLLLLVILASTIGMSILSWYFSSMTVDVTDDELNWRFAGGRGYTIARAEIDRVRAVPHRWWAGYGIKYFGPKRWTYVIGGCDTVEVSLKSGGWRRLGTDDPRGLLAALQRPESS